MHTSCWESIFRHKCSCNARYCVKCIDLRHSQPELFSLPQTNHTVLETEMVLVTELPPLEGSFMTAKEIDFKFYCILK